MAEQGDHMHTHLPTVGLRQYIVDLEKRREDIKKTFAEMFKLVFPIDSGITKFEDQIKMLDEEDKHNPLVECKMQGEVQSYDVLQNEKYARLDKLKLVLDDNIRLATSGTSPSKLNISQKSQ